MTRSGRLDGSVRHYEASEVVGESTMAAYRAAQDWLLRTSQAPDRGPVRPIP